jgi:hypothetical protein
LSKFNVRAAKPSVTSPIVTEQRASGHTYEGGPGYARDAKSELFLLAVSNMVGERAFYESANDRDARYEQLVHQVAAADPQWTAGFLRWLRGEGNMRSASLVGALEATKAMLAANVPGSRQMIASVLQRADEPGEALAYWMSRYGRKLPMPVKRGIADAARKLYTEYNLLKYDTASKGFRFADVLDLTHPDATDIKQATLFKLALDRRHNRDGIPSSLAMVRLNAKLRENAARGEYGDLLDPNTLKGAGMTWEDVLSLAGSKLDKAKLWSALIPSMGYMALLRNLRNFDEAGVPDDVADKVAARLADPQQVAKSRQLPMRFLSAYRAAPSLRWGYPLEKALGHSLANIPVLSGRTLILVDTSSSMNGSFSKDGTLMRWDAAVLFGVALAQRCANADVVSFSSTAQYWGQAHGAHTKVFPLTAGESLLKSLERWKGGGWFLGGGTATAAAVRKHFAGHDRIVILTDEQAASDWQEVGDSAPKTTPMTTFNLAGYERGHAPGGPNRLTIGGLTDAGFKVIPLVESGRNAAWPWLQPVS